MAYEKMHSQEVISPNNQRALRVAAADAGALIMNGGGLAIMGQGFRKYGLGILAFLLLAAIFCPSANANLVIDGTFGSSITDLSDAATIEAGIDQAISRLEAAIENPITVNIDFEDDSQIALGENLSFSNFLPYSTYLSDLKNNQILSAEDKTALASLPVQADNPVDGNSDVELALPLLRAIGETTLGSNSGLDGTVELNLSKMNVSRSGTQNSQDYDLQAVATHEMDEVLGIGGGGSELASGTTSAVGSFNIFRYSAPGVRSYSQSENIASYFSINGGTNNLVYFNQYAMADYGDWGDGSIPAAIAGNSPPEVQDAFAAPGVDVNLGTNELIALDVVGYNLTEAIPEPGAFCLLAVGLIAAGIHGRRFKNSTRPVQPAKPAACARGRQQRPGENSAPVWNAPSWPGVPCRK